MKKLLVTVVLDASGSMQKIKDKTISCFNEYIDTLLPYGKACHMTITQFNSNEITDICKDMPIKDVPKLSNDNYKPDGWTPLYDAVCKTIVEIEKDQKDSVEAEDILFVVITDGEENSSKEYAQKDIIEMITNKEKDSWTFVYLGANQDSWKSASSIGYSSSGNINNFEASNFGVSTAFANLSDSTVRYQATREKYYAETDYLPSIDVSNYSKIDFFNQETSNDILDTINNKKGGKKNGRTK